MSSSWTIESGPEVVAPVGDHQRFIYVLTKGDERREVFVEITGTAAASDVGGLLSPSDDAVASQGRSVLERQLNRVEPVAEVLITTTAVRSVPRLGYYEPGDRIVAREEGRWEPFEFVETGDQQDALTVRDAHVVSGSRQKDVAWGRLRSSGELVARTYDQLRPERPADD